MRAIIMCISLIVSVSLLAQSKIVTEQVAVTSQDRLDLDFAFADAIVFETWEKKEVYVEVEVLINDGEHNDIFTLNSSSTDRTIYIEMDEDMWDKVDKKVWRKNCTWVSTLNYKVYLPDNMTIKAKTISGNYEFEYFGKPLHLKTISGVIDMTVPETSALDFKAETISGEVYSDLDIDFPQGKEGLRQIVGQKVFGRIKSGGPQLRFETISGDIYLRGKS